jgi:hypothetical protein
MKAALLENGHRPDSDGQIGLKTCRPPKSHVGSPQPNFQAIRTADFEIWHGLLKSVKERSTTSPSG